MRARPERPPDFAMPWWASPVGINLGFLLPMLLLIASVDPTSFEGLTIRGIRFLTVPYIALGAGLILVMAFGGWLGSQIRITKLPNKQLDVRVYEKAALVVGSIALGAYLIFFRDFVVHPGLLIRTLTGSYRPDRTTISLSVGITSFVNVAPVFFSIYGYLQLALREHLRRRTHGMFIVLSLCTLFRVYAWSERLALVEATVPLVLAMASRPQISSRHLFRLMARLGPYAALPLVILYFGLAESVRSWKSSTYHAHLGFWHFVIGRLTTYYYTSLNNGAGVLATTAWPTYKFEITLAWLHKAPLVGHIFSSLVNLRYYELAQFLGVFGDEEFNNPSGLFGVVYDIGLPLAVVYFAAVGFVAALLLGAYRSRRRLGILLYPMFFLFFLEIFRYPYFGAPRAFTWALGMLIAIGVSHAATHRVAAHLQPEPTQ